MGYNLTIDQGNSSAKVAVWDEVEIIFDAKFLYLTSEDIETILAKYPNIDKAIYCSVANSGNDIIKFLNNNGVPTINLDIDTPLPISNAYKSPHTLGRDRIAAAVGAWSRFPNRDLLIIDMGTAITYDVVLSNGSYIGGNIAPGINMRLEALNNYTSRLPIVNPKGDCPLWGVNTETAMRSGAVIGVVGEIAYYKSQMHQNHLVILTGGSVDFIDKFIDFPIEIDQHLVTRGLNSILTYNENI
jgi:type III pantothenate kinase